MVCLLIQVAFCWDFDVKSMTGGPFGTTRHKAELAHGANNGLDIAARLVDPIKEQFRSCPMAMSIR